MSLGMFFDVPSPSVTLSSSGVTVVVDVLYSARVPPNNDEMPFISCRKPDCASEIVTSVLCSVSYVLKWRWYHTTYPHPYHRIVWGGELVAGRRPRLPAFMTQPSTFLEGTKATSATPFAMQPPFHPLYGTPDSRQACKYMFLGTPRLIWSSQLILLGMLACFTARPLPSPRHVWEAVFVNSLCSARDLVYR